MNRRIKIWAGTGIRLVLHPLMLVARPAPAQQDETEILLGGQAVIEGVMMRAPHSYSISVRKPDGGIVRKRDSLRSPADRWRGFRLPMLRGLGTLGQTLSLGIRALRFSANVALEEEAKAKAEKGTKPRGDSADPKTKKQELPGWLLGLQVAFSILFFIFLYKYVPLVIATQAENRGLSRGWIGFNLIDGLVRLLIFLAFIWLISLWKDIRRTYEYHGAEHMTVYTWEAHRPVTVEDARAFPPEHPRCGTSFLMVVILISLMIYTLVPVESFAWRLLVRIALLPVIVGASYEVIRAAGKRRQSRFWRVAVTPGLWLQRLITTRQPSDDQIQVAIHALEGALEIERRRNAQPAPAGD